MKYRAGIALFCVCFILCSSVLPIAAAELLPPVSDEKPVPPPVEEPAPVPPPVEEPTPVPPPVEGPAPVPPPVEEPAPVPPAENESKATITSIFQLSSATNPILLSCGDQEQWNNELEHWKTFFSFIVGITDNVGDDDAVLTLDSMDASQVDLSKAGDYFLTVYLKIDETAQDWQQFVLPEELATVKIPVSVADPKEFRLYVTNTNNSQRLSVNWVFALDDQKPVQIFYTSSKEPLSEKSINSAAWQLCEDPAFAGAGANGLSIFRSALDHETHYYFRLKQGDLSSDVLHILDRGSAVLSDSMQGNRDGGDTVEPSEDPPILQPPPEDPQPEKPLPSLPDLGQEEGSSKPQPPAAELPDPPVLIPGFPGDLPALILPEPSKPTEEAIAQSPPPMTAPVQEITVPAQKTESARPSSPDTPAKPASSFLPAEMKKQEIITQNASKISGTRLRYLMQNNQSGVPFAHNDISIRLSNSFLESLKIPQSSFFTVEILRSANGFRFSLKVDDAAVALTEPAKVAYWCEEAPQSLWFGQEELSSPIRYQDQTAFFTIEKTGSYRLSSPPKEEAAAPVRESNAFTTLLPAFGGCFFLGILWKNKGAVSSWSNRKKRQS